MINNKVSKAVRLAIAFGSASTAAFSVSSFAADEGVDKVERIEVTGSRIRSTDLETAQPIQTITREDIANQGFTSVIDLLENMSASGAPPISRAAPLSSGENVGGNYVNLRGLGASRTLVLVNGKRLGITTSGLQDISAIPMGMVERIDVLKDGASAMYGSDAMAGVVNIITRKNFEGLEFTVYGGEYDEGDGEKKNISMVTGIAGERGSITFGAEWRDEGDVWAKDRYFSEVGYPGYDIPNNRTLVGQYGRFSYNDQWWVAKRPGDASSLDDFEPQTYENGSSNPQEQMHVETPLSARSLYISSNYAITDDINFTSDIGYSERSARRQIAGYPYQSASDGIVLSADSHFNPVGEDVSFTRRGWEVPRTTDSNQDTIRFTAAIEGSFEVGSHYFDWDIGGVYSKSSSLGVSSGDLYKPAIKAATGPSFLNASGQVQCGTEAAPISLSECTPWNPLAGFGAGTVDNSLADPAVQDFLIPTLHYRGETETAIYFANISGLLAQLPAGDLSFALGAEHRKEKGEYAPDALAQLGESTTLAAGATGGEYDVSELFAELDIPILSGVAGAHELTLNLATRYSDYSTFGDTTNSKIGIKWRPVEELLIRGTWSEGFRAPTISDLYGGGSQTFTTGFIDPCDSVYGVAKGSARCLQDVPADYRQLQQGFVPTTGPAAQTPVPFNSGSNEFLQPEESTTKTIGFVYNPELVENLDIIVDWWSITIDNTVVADSPNQILDDCYIGLDESRCDMFSRDPNSFIVNNLSYGNRNAGFTETAGYDLALAYPFETSFGDFRATMDMTYVTKYDEKSSDEPEVKVTSDLGHGSTFRVRSNAGLKWSYEDFSASWNMRYFSSMRENCYFEDRCNVPDFQRDWTNGTVVPKQKNGSTIFNDVQVSYNLPWEGAISVGANNIFDKQGPLMYSRPSSNYSYYGGFDIGRFWYFRYTQSF
ncbi:TonB-dependent receptor [Pseudoalteromonas sp. S1727]|uniref:TonB-dependent receptor domain-containing protein n=1 Tax=Pseudoalteromonas sp. S1727 TaxID=2066514 RepID=UPI001108E960|nr:TonB-dependent receptor [Pseudoalteromonas sp. S1727]TMN66319.1 TonB-dependent receptor [Pseudoalteromonas sp. S1727]